MLTITFLGTGAALATPARDNTSLAIDDGAEVSLVDASGAPLSRLTRAGIPHERLARVIITHEHVDHTYGLPSLLQSLWLAGRTDPLPLYAPRPTWQALDRLIAAYWPDGFARGFRLDPHVLDGSEDPFVQTPRLAIRAASGQHSVPTIALRFEPASGGTFVYSSDTAPCPTVEACARGAALLAHEATFLTDDRATAGQLGHSTARQAGEVAARAGVRGLALVHFSAQQDGDLATLRNEASVAYRGPIAVPGDGDRLFVD